MQKFELKGLHNLSRASHVISVQQPGPKLRELSGTNRSRSTHPNLGPKLHELLVQKRPKST